MKRRVISLMNSQRYKVMKMKNVRQWLAAGVTLASVVGAGNLFAEDAKDKPENRREAMLKRFDKDGDGKLSEDEKAELRKARQERSGDRPERKRGWSRDGDSDRHKAMREKLLKEFDKDGDGELSDEEKKAAREAWAKRREDRNKREAAVHAKFVQKYDTDGDGKLSEQERKSAHAAMTEAYEAFKAEMVKLYDADGDGKLSEEERQTARDKEKEKMLEKFDKDGDGELNKEERQAAFDDMLENRPFRIMHHMMRKHHDHKHGHRGEGGPHGQKGDKPGRGPRGDGPPSERRGPRGPAPDEVPKNF